MNALIIAHRGESFDAPENTLASINLAWERGADAVELDVHLTADKKIVVIHDPTTKRTAGVNKKVKNLTLSELKKLDVGSWKNLKYNTEKIPTLKEILHTIPFGKKLIIEIKSSIKILPFLKEEIKSANLESQQIEFISFNYEIVVQIKKLMPEYKVLFLSDLDYTWYTKILSPSVNKLIEKAKKANLDGLDVWGGKLLNKEFAHKIKSAGLLLYVWTVDDPDHAKRLISWGIDGITTNKAAWLTNSLAAFKK